MSDLILYLVSYDPQSRKWFVTIKDGESAMAGARYGDKGRALIAAQQAARAAAPSRLVVHREDGVVEFDWVYGAVPIVRSIPAAPPERLEAAIAATSVRSKDLSAG